MQVFDKYDVLTPRELHSRYEIYIEQYIKYVNVEAKLIDQDGEDDDLAGGAPLPRSARAEHRVGEGRRAQREHEARREGGELTAELEKAIGALETATAHTRRRARSTRPSTCATRSCRRCSPCAPRPTRSKASSPTTLAAADVPGDALHPLRARRRGVRAVELEPAARFYPSSSERRSISRRKRSGSRTGARALRERRLGERPRLRAQAALSRTPRAGAADRDRLLDARFPLRVRERRSRRASSRSRWAATSSGVGQTTKFCSSASPWHETAAMERAQLLERLRRRASTAPPRRAAPARGPARSMVFRVLPEGRQASIGRAGHEASAEDAARRSRSAAEPR